jgi:hypothetical protein
VIRFDIEERLLRIGTGGGDFRPMAVAKSLIEETFIFYHQLLIVRDLCDSTPCMKEGVFLNLSAAEMHISYTASFVKRLVSL